MIPVVSNVPLCFVYIVQKIEGRLDRLFGWDQAVAGTSGSFLFFSGVCIFIQATSLASQILPKQK